jgi:hypothetical protein
MTIKGFLAIVILLAALPLTLFSQSQYDTTDIKRHLFYLASDELGGREPETAGSQKASLYLRDLYAKMGLKLLFDKGFQHFQFINGWTSGDSNVATLNGRKLQIEKDYVPMDYFQTRLASLDADVVAVWGNINRFKDFEPEFKNRWVMLLPLCYDSLSVQHRVVKLMRAGAAGVLIVTDSLRPEIDNVYNIPVYKTTNMGPVVCISPAIADSLLKGTGETLEKMVVEEILSEETPYTHKNIRKLKQSISVTTHFLPTYTNAKNVVAYLEGSDPVLKNEIIVVGGHYDHLGTKNRISKKTGQPVTLIYNGADDNGSGSVGVLELAQKYSQQENRPKRSVIFVNFDAEELGLIGSKHFFDDTTVINPRNVKAMINLDMIGRYTEEKGVEVMGVNTAEESRELQKLISKKTQLKMSFPTSPLLFFGSDHVNFYKLQIPSVFFCTKVHADYHKPTDTPEKINYQAMSQILQMADRLLDNLANRKKNLHFKEMEF